MSEQFRTEDSSQENPKWNSDLREERLTSLMESCQQEVLRQIIGPFGLTPAMFDDKDGGNVATVHNAEKSVFPDELHKENYVIANEKYSQKIRQKHWDDKKSRGKTHKEINQTLVTGQDVLSEATLRPMTKGNVNGDHDVSLKEAHGDKNLHLRFSEEERKSILNSEENMAFIEESLNKSKGKKSWSECLSDSEFIEKNNLTPEDVKRIRKNDEVARNYIQSEKDKRLAGELLSTGAKEVGKNALRQAFGVLLHEFVNGSFIELRVLLKSRDNEHNLIDQVIEGLQRVMQRVAMKLKDAWHGLIEGGVQGFISNFLTYLINCIITTSAKVVTIIREGMKGLWTAIKLMLSPPANMSTMEVAREASKIIAGVVTMGLGMLLEESIKGFISSIPLLLPLADYIAPAIAAIITGITAALVVYGIDRLFDWLSSKGTELLLAQEKSNETKIEVIDKLQEWMQAQYCNSHLYNLAASEYRRIHETYAISHVHVETAVNHAKSSIQSRERTIETLEERLNKQRAIDEELHLSINNFPLGNN
jgi:hypothetical protein